MNIHAGRLSALREAMAGSGIDLYIIPTGDPNLGEYVPDHWRIIPWLTGFTGSAATLVISRSFAGLWTDSRYFVQAREQLRDSGFEFMKPVSDPVNDITGWLPANTVNGSTIAIDGRTVAIGRMRRIEMVLQDNNVKFITDIDLISPLWNDRPPVPDSPAFDFPVLYAGLERSAKIAAVREVMQARNIDYHLLTAVDDIMWLLNIRGSDVKYSPLLSSFSIISHEQVLLLLDENKIPLRLAAEFDRIGVVLLPYEETGAILSSLPPESTILVSPAATSASLYRSIPIGMKIVEDFSIPARLKAVKNKTEIENIGLAMIKDGIALTRFFIWLGENMGEIELTECSLAEKLTGLRSEQEGFLGPSFSPIVAFGEHGALPHYSATAESDATLGHAGILLIDSGGQYLNGTTDITRTISLGRPSQGQTRDFTLVLKGNIGLASVKIPYGTKGVQLDILARRSLWENGLNYGHGTGHGVGFCLNVHEGPQSISGGNTSEARTVIEPGMLISNEPAIYREGEYGIRTENLILCYEDEETEFGKFLKFETVSLCIIDKSLIDISLLERQEIAWLNNYHAIVYDKLAPHLTPEEREWLKDKTTAI